MPEEDEEKQPKPEPKKDDVEKYISSHVHYSKENDELLDVHIGNPLNRIAKLLEEIKKQKAFSFSLKGSLGLAGVVLAFSFLGVLGAGNVLCSKGVQSEIGVVKVLNMLEPDPPGIPVISDFINYFKPRSLYKATVLVQEDNFVIHLPQKQGLNLDEYAGLPVIATGQYDSCSRSLAVENQNGVEAYPQ